MPVTFGANPAEAAVGMPPPYRARRVQESLSRPPRPLARRDCST